MKKVRCCCRGKDLILVPADGTWLMSCNGSIRPRGESEMNSRAIEQVAVESGEGSADMKHGEWQGDLRWQLLRPSAVPFAVAPSE